MSKTVLTPSPSDCSCQVEVECAENNSPCGVRIIYCAKHAHCGEMLSVLRNLETVGLSPAAQVSLKNVLDKMEKAS